jgi:uncharacterized protein YbbK (DUF523 family)
MRSDTLRIGISQCLLGDHVRYDGGHKRDSLLADIVGRYVEWVPVCPEVEAGFGVPREAMRLIGTLQAPRLMTVTTGIDQTQSMEQWCRRRIRELEKLNLAGYVFKSRSPSCGIGGVPLFSTQAMETQDGVGLFARAFMEHFPLMPVEDEDRLHDPQILKNFLERASAYCTSRKNVKASS